MKLLYLHGFRSSPNSAKATSVVAYCREHGLSEPMVPQLPISPKESVELCEEIIQKHDIDAICGSSLGGFYATYLTEKYPLRCALINPAVTPWKELEKEYVHNHYKVDEVAQEDAERFLAELKTYEVKQITDYSRYLLLASMDDEVLNPWQMRYQFKGAQQIILETGGHALSDFGGQLETLMSFLNSSS